MTDLEFHAEDTDVLELTDLEIDHVSGAFGAGGGGGAGKVSMQDIHFVVRSTRAAFV